MPGEDKKTETGRTVSTVIPKIPTRIKGLDRILHGGLPEKRTTLVSGGPGSGKSMVGLEFIYRSAMAGEPGIFLTFEETKACVVRNALTLGWDLPALEKKGMLFLMESRIDPNLLISGDFNAKALFAILEGKIRAMNADRIVIDAMDVLVRLFEDPGRRQNEFYILNQWLKQQQLTCILTAKNIRDKTASDFSYLDFMADCVIRLDQRVQDQVTTKRLQVTKYRGSGYSENEHPFFISTSGIHFNPISDIGMHYESGSERVSSGHPSLDTILGGGYKTGTCILISGLTGTGKTTLASLFAHSVCAGGQKALYLNYEESQKSMFSGMLSVGIDLRPAMDSAFLQMTSVMPESMGIEEQLFHVIRAIKNYKPEHLVVDAISACRRIAGEEAAFDFVMRIVDVCKRSGITVVLINQTKSSSGFFEFSGVGISSVADTIINLQYKDTGNELTRRLMVIKSRGSRHSHKYHDYKLTGQGLEIDTDPDQP